MSPLLAVAICVGGQAAPPPTSRRLLVVARLRLGLLARRGSALEPCLRRGTPRRSPTPRPIPHPHSPTTPPPPLLPPPHPPPPDSPTALTAWRFYICIWPKVATSSSSAAQTRPEPGGCGAFLRLGSMLFKAQVRLGSEGLGRESSAVGAAGQPRTPAEGRGRRRGAAALEAERGWRRGGGRGGAPGAGRGGGHRGTTRVGPKLRLWASASNAEGERAAGCRAWGGAPGPPRPGVAAAAAAGLPRSRSCAGYTCALVSGGGYWVGLGDGGARRRAGGGLRIGGGRAKRNDARRAPGRARAGDEGRLEGRAAAPKGMHWVGA
jgi:hypothetical protein